MKKLFSLTCIFLFVLTMLSYGQRDSLHRKQPLSAAELQARQQRFEQHADSAIASRTVVRMKELFTVTAQQEQDLYQAGVTINNQHRAVFKTYWKTDAFRAQMAKADSAADILYQSIVGVANYQAYKDALHSRLVQKQQVMQQRATTDSLNRKNVRP